MSADIPERRRTGGGSFLSTRATLTSPREPGSVGAFRNARTALRTGSRLSGEHPQVWNLARAFELSLFFCANELEAGVLDEPAVRCRVEVAEEHRLSEPLGHDARLVVDLEGDQQAASGTEPAVDGREQRFVRVSRQVVDDVKGDDRVERAWLELELQRARLRQLGFRDAPPSARELLAGDVDSERVVAAVDDRAQRRHA